MHTLDGTDRAMMMCTHKATCTFSWIKVFPHLLASTYPEGAFEILFVISVNRRKDLEKLEDALLLVQVGEQLEGLLDQLSQRLGLQRTEETHKRSQKLDLFI